MPDSRETKLRSAFVVGHPIAHSRSPVIHQYWLKKHQLEGTYQRIDVTPAEFSSFMAGLRSGLAGFSGGNVTLPHKEAAFALADVKDDIASEIGAVNTLWLQEGRVFATNTDSLGFSANLDDHAPSWRQKKKAVVLGAGGASRAVVHALKHNGFAEINIVNRTLGRAEELAARFGSTALAHPLDALAELLQGADFFVNTTSLGLADEAEMSIDFSQMAPQAIVTDIVYTPLETPFLKKAAQQGFQTVDGLGMLLHQAVPGFEKWFGVKPEVDGDLRNHVLAEMARGK